MLTVNPLKREHAKKKQFRFQWRFRWLWLLIFNSPTHSFYFFSINTYNVTRSCCQHKSSARWPSLFKEKCFSVEIKMDQMPKGNSVMNNWRRCLNLKKLKIAFCKRRKGKPYQYIYTKSRKSLLWILYLLLYFSISFRFCVTCFSHLFSLLWKFWDGKNLFLFVEILDRDYILNRRDVVQEKSLMIYWVKNIACQNDT